MIGRALIESCKAALGGISDHDLYDLYRCLDDAAIEFCSLTHCIHRTVTHSTPADPGDDHSAAVRLPSSFLSFFERDGGQRFYVRYKDPEGNVTFPRFTTKEILFSRPEDPEVGAPISFCLIPNSSLVSNVEGAATSPCRPISGECELIDTGATFLTDGIEARDSLLNIRDGSIGIISAVLTETNLSVCLFNGDTNDFANSDDYIISPAPSPELWFDSLPEPGSEIEIRFSSKPSPVYCHTRTWEIPERWHQAIIWEGVYRFKQDYDYDPARDDHLHLRFLEAVREYQKTIGRQNIRKGRRTR